MCGWNLLFDPSVHHRPRTPPLAREPAPECGERRDRQGSWYDSWNGKRCVSSHSAKKSGTCRSDLTVSLVPLPSLYPCSASRCFCQPGAKTEGLPTWRPLCTQPLARLVLLRYNVVVWIKTQTARLIAGCLNIIPGLAERAMATRD